MMKRLLIWLSLVIILVCLNWFKHLAAQDLSGVSDAEKAKLLSRLSHQPTVVDKSNRYESAPIYEENYDSLYRFPDSVDTLACDAEDHTYDTKTPESALVSFEDLVPFGTELFAGPRETAPPTDIAASPDYRLGPGDNLIVTLWGQVDKEYSLTVDREGMVFVPQVGRLHAYGQTLEQFQQAMYRKLSSHYSGFELSVSLGKIRSIRIYLTGEVRRPGAYTVSSLTSLFNALYLAGGPNENGSMRTIRLMRNGNQAAEVDLYRFLLEGDNSTDIRLESGDAIFVPVAGPRVGIRGKIRRPAVYELKGEQDALELLSLAGRPAADAYLDRVMLERISGRDDWTVLDLNLNANEPDSVINTVLADGDRMTVFSIFEVKHNMVAAFGLVKHPGYYERSDTTRVSDLIERAKLQPYDVYLERANIFRRHDDWRREVISVDLGRVLQGSVLDDVVLQDGDSLHVYAISDVSWDRYVNIEGQVKRPGRYAYYDDMTVEDLIFLAGSYSRGASRLRAEIARVDSVGEVALREVSLADPAARRTPLTEDDRVYIRQLPQWQMHRTVRIEGEVMYPGEYVLAGDNETLYQLIQRAGGLTKTAFPRGTIFQRASIGESLAQKQIPSLLNRSTPLVQDSAGNMIREEVVEFDANSMNRIVLDVDRLLETAAACCDLVMEPGDRIHIPPTPSGISVLGAVGSSGTIKYVEGKNAKYYLKRAGNFTKRADKGSLRLIRANGEVYSGGGTAKKHVELGDIIVVPTKIHREKNFTKAFTTTLTAVTGVLTTILLIDRL
jgi:protein involved in polysaccharide export with SLBB domain